MTSGIYPRVPGPNSPLLRDDVIVVYCERRDKNATKKYVRVKRKQRLTSERWQALQALDRFFGYTGSAGFLMRQNDALKK